MQRFYGWLFAVSLFALLGLSHSSSGQTMTASVSPDNSTIACGTSVDLTASVVLDPVPPSSPGIMKFTEITQWGSGAGSTPAMPAYSAGDDFIEIANLGGAPLDIGGYSIQCYGGSTNSITFGSPLVINPGDVVLIHNGTGTDSPADLYFNTGGLSNSTFSSEAVGYVMRDGGGNVIDVVATNSYNVVGFVADVTAADWSGTAPPSGGDAGLIRLVSDTNTAADWNTSDSPDGPQTLSVLNPTLSAAVTEPTYTWSPNIGLSSTTGTTVTATPPGGSFAYTVTAELAGYPTTTTTVVVNVTGCTYTNTVDVSPSSATIECGNTVTFNANVTTTPTPAPGAPADLKFTEITQWSGGAGSTPSLPAYASGDDYIEVTNLGGTAVDISGYSIQCYGGSTNSITFTGSVVVGPGDVVLIHNGTGTDSPADLYFNTGGLSNSTFSSEAVGYVMRDGGGNVIDVVATNSYNVVGFVADVTAADWGGTAPPSGGDAGLIRLVSDTNTAADWNTSDSPDGPQTLGTFNPALPMPTPAFELNYLWLDDPSITTATDGNSITVAPEQTTTYGLYVWSSDGTYEYTEVTVTVNDIPGAAISPATQLVGCGNLATVNADIVPVADYTINWYRVSDDTFLGTGASLSFIPDDHEFVYYTATPVSGTGCSYISDNAYIEFSTFSLSVTPSVAYTFTPVTGQTMDAWVTGGVGPYTYEIFEYPSMTPVAGYPVTTASTLQSTVVSPTTTQQYYFRVTDALGCVQEDYNTILVDVPLPDIGPDVFPVDWIYAEAIDETSMRIRFYDSNDSEDFHRLYRIKENSSFPEFITEFGPLVGETIYIDSESLTADTRYSYYVTTFKNTGLPGAPILGKDSDLASDITYPNVPTTEVVNACFGSTGVITAEGDHQSNEYYWYTSNDTSEAAISRNGDAPFLESAFETDNLTSNTTYYVTAKGRKYESKPRLAVEVEVLPLPTAAFEDGSTEVIYSCDETASLSAVAVEGATYHWYNGGNLIGTTTEPNFEVSSAGSYSVTVEGVNGCTASSEMRQVFPNFTPEARILQGASYRFCESGILEADEVSGATYEWYRGADLLGTGTSVEVTEEGEYTLVVLLNGCSASAVTSVDVLSFPDELVIESSGLQMCPGETVNLTATFVEGATYEWLRNGRREAAVAGNTLTTDKPGEFTVSISLSSTCAALSESITIERFDVSRVELTRVDEQIILEVVDGSSPSSVRWFLDGEEQTALADQTTITPSSDGVYIAEITFATGCETFSNSVRFFGDNNVTGIEGELAALTRVYPNPTSGMVSVTLDASIAKGDISIAVTDDLGRVIEEFNFTAAQAQSPMQLNLTDYATGMYMIRIQTEKGLIVKKITRID